jgi:gluconolactonase
MNSRLILPIVAISLVSCASQTSPLVRGAKPHDYGKIGAGEGPAFKNGVLYFTDGKGINQLNLATGRASVFRTKCGSPNGLMFNTKGEMIRCESKGRRLTVEKNDGTVTLLADRYEGHRFNSPNDLTRDSLGFVYFTDPRYGDRNGMEIRDRKGRLVEGVYRINHEAKLPPGLCSFAYDVPNVTLILGPDDVERPNGILITPDDKYLYVADNNNNTAGGSRKLLRFSLNKDCDVIDGTRKVIFDWKGGRGPDGVKMDAAGRLYVAAGVNKPNEFETDEFKAGCYILSPGGKLLDFVPTAPDEATNCALGGDDKKTLFMTSGGHLWSVPLK